MQLLPEHIIKLRDNTCETNKHLEINPELTFPIQHKQMILEDMK